MFRSSMLFRRIRRSNQTYRSLRVPVHFPFQMFHWSERASTVTIALSDQHRTLAEFDPFYRSKLQLRAIRDYFADDVLFATTILQNTLCNSIPKLTAGDSRSWNSEEKRKIGAQKTETREASRRKREFVKRQSGTGLSIDPSPRRNEGTPRWLPENVHAGPRFTSISDLA